MPGLEALTLVQSFRKCSVVVPCLKRFMRDALL